MILKWKCFAYLGMIGTKVITVLGNVKSLCDLETYGFLLALLCCLNRLQNCGCVADSMKISCSQFHSID